MVTFYRSFLLVSLFINLCCIRIFLSNGMSSFSTLFWFKITTLGITGYYIHSFKSKEYYYYLNLGLSKSSLWTTTLLFDLFLFVFLIIQINHFI